ncbi:homoserine O-succinyltransferase [Streptomyces sp. NBC_01233]|uniref:homoserine O-succinyltransferase n=1 Tax=Streptomyces sp. NBC_01233 TaxID=2903787 RepID=UPI002E14D0F6|nr:homoserine O-succinyltransferase [Streptomyces sp. NBC_01233]
MPLILPTPVDAKAELAKENIPVLDEVPDGADFLDVAVLNIMPNKPVTETQLLRLLSVSPLPVRTTWLRPAAHVSKSTPQAYLDEHYQVHAEVADRRFDALIVTGAPVEELDFEEVTYWDELREIMDWARTHVTSTMYICWGAQAALYHHYGISKHHLGSKMFGNFATRAVEENAPLLAGFDEEFHVPHSRYTGTLLADLQAEPEIEVLAQAQETGFYVAGRRDGREFYVSGHPEYDRNTLREQYERDTAKGLPMHVPPGYYPGDDPARTPVRNWHAHGRLLYANWLGHYVHGRRAAGAR